MQRLPVAVVEESPHRLRSLPRGGLHSHLWVHVQGSTTAHRQATPVRALLHAREPAEHLQLVLLNGPVETGQEDVRPRASVGDQHLPDHPRVDAVRRPVPLRERARQGHNTRGPGDRAVLVVRLVHAVVRAVRAEVYVRVLVGAKRQNVTAVIYIPTVGEHHLLLAPQAMPEDWTQGARCRGLLVPAMLDVILFMFSP